MRKRRKRWPLVALIGLLMLAGCTILIPPVGGEAEIPRADIEVEVEISSVNPVTGQWYFDDNPDDYLAWRNNAPHAYEHLINTGYEIWHNLHTYPMSDGFREAAITAFFGHCIDDYLSSRGSPLAGYGVNFAREGRLRGIDPFLLVALTAAESTLATDGSLCRTHHNAWGMRGPNKTGLYTVNGWMWWPDWESAIAGAAYFVDCYWPNAQSAYDCRGYCAGNPPSWFTTVAYIQGEMLGGL